MGLCECWRFGCLAQRVFLEVIGKFRMPLFALHPGSQCCANSLAEGFRKRSVRHDIGAAIQEESNDGWFPGEQYIRERYGLDACVMGDEQLYEIQSSLTNRIG